MGHTGSCIRASVLLYVCGSVCVNAPTKPGTSFCRYLFRELRFGRESVCVCVCVCVCVSHLFVRTYVCGVSFFVVQTAMDEGRKE